MLILAALVVMLIGMAGAANYMYEKASVKGVGYKNVEMIISTQTGFNGDKLVEKESGSGNVIAERTELEAERQLNRQSFPLYWDMWIDEPICDYQTFCSKGYITSQGASSVHASLPDGTSTTIGLKRACRIQNRAVL